MIRLHVNVDHVCTLRNARGTVYPDPVRAARICLEAGAHGITAHLREDRRHIRDADIEELRRVKMPVFNFECAPTEEMIDIARSVRPDCITLVPERREERTTEGGLDVVGGGKTLEKRVRELVDADLRVSMFIAPQGDQVKASAAIGAKQIEIHTGEYAHEGEAILSAISRAATLGKQLGVEVAAGHGLTTENVPALLRAAPEIVELNIGHAIVADAVFMGLAGAVKAMLAAMK